MIVNLVVSCLFLVEFMYRCESKVPFELVKLNLGAKRFISMPDGSNVYKTLIGKMDMFQSKLLKETDDTVSFILLTKVT